MYLRTLVSQYTIHGFTYSRLYFMSLNMTFFRTEVVNEDEVLGCINNAIEIDEKDLDYTLIKDFDD